MKYMRGPNGKVKPILDIYEAHHLELGWELLSGQELADYLAEEAYFAALRVRERYRTGAVSSRKLTKAEEAAIIEWEKRAAEIAAQKASAEKQPA